jgi:hypothetical protein
MQQHELVLAIGFLIMVCSDKSKSRHPAATFDTTTQLRGTSHNILTQTP